MKLDQQLLDHYSKNKNNIQKRLIDFKNVPRENYFYELCYCICTPQSKAIAAEQVQNKLANLDFFNKKFNPVNILNSPEHYIRFHNQKAERLLLAIDIFQAVLEILDSNETSKHKRNLLKRLVNGFGMKEASHFMRNIGYEGLAILDRHILKNLVKLQVYDKIPLINTEKNYQIAEEQFINFSCKINIPIDELDLLFWSFENGNILK